MKQNGILLQSILLATVLTCTLTACSYTDYVREFIEQNAVSGSSVSGAAAGNTSGSGVSADSTASGSSVSGSAVMTASGSGVYSSAYVTAEMQTAEYWIGKSYAKDKVLLTESEIQSVNEKRLKDLSGDSNAVFYDIQNYDEKIKGSVLHMLMAQEDLLNTSVYDTNGDKISSDVLKAFMDNCGIKDIADFNNVRYGIVCEECVVQKLPAHDKHVITGERAMSDMASLRISTLMVNEPVLILYTSLDKAWYFVMSENCTGWVTKEALAFCDSKNAWQEAQETDDFIVVSDRKLWLDSENKFSMGTKLVIATGEEAQQYMKKYPVHDSYLVRVPVADKDGKLTFKIREIPIGENVHRGYLEYTRANILTQAMKFTGSFSGNGDFAEEQVVECIYSCFGFKLPLDRKTWTLIPADNRIDIAVVEDKLTKNDTNRLNPGMILVRKNRPCIYLGYQDGRAYALTKSDGVMTVKTIE